MAYRGDSVRIEFTSADASTAAAISIYTADGVLITLGSGNFLNHRLNITAINIAQTAVTIDLFDDADADGAIDAGERLVSTAAVAGTMTQVYVGEALPCGKGRNPKIKASGAGAVAVTGLGFLTVG